MQQATEERRRRPRLRSFHSQELLRVSFDNGEVSPLVEAFVVNLNDEGLGLEVPCAITPGTLVFITGILEVGIRQRKLIRCPGRIARCEAVAGGNFFVGLRFVDEAEAKAKEPESAEYQEIPDYYDILQVSPKADAETIHGVYRLLAQRYHPDNPETGSEERFKPMMEAYLAISDPAKRAEYDRMRGTAQPVNGTVCNGSGAYERNAEKRRRAGILSVLYGRRMSSPRRPSVDITEFEAMLGCPREQLEFSLWYLTERGTIAPEDEAGYAITAAGVEQVEAAGESIFGPESTPQRFAAAG